MLTQLILSSISTLLYWLVCDNLMIKNMFKDMHHVILISITISDLKWCSDQLWSFSGDAVSKRLWQEIAGLPSK